MNYTTKHAEISAIRAKMARLDHEQRHDFRVAMLAAIVFLVLIITGSIGLCVLLDQERTESLLSTMVGALYVLSFIFLMIAMFKFQSSCWKNGLVAYLILDEYYLSRPTRGIYQVG